jgi:predicted amidohydrolase
VTAVAVVQLTRPHGGDDNRAASVDAARDAFGSGAEIVVLPELIVPGYGWDPGTVERLAEPLDGPTVTAWTAVARDAGGLVAGGFAERDGDRLFNTAVVVDGGGVVLHYRKLHPFSGEKDVYTPGDLGLPVADTRFGAIGLCVCYDLRFVETLRVLALRGAALVCVPTAWVPGFDSERWDENGFCPQARSAVVQANLDQVFVACASQAGRQAEFEFLGSSLVVDPRGRVLAGPLPGDRDETAIVELDMNGAGASFDRGGGVRPRDDRRTDVYALAVGDERL